MTQANIGRYEVQSEIGRGGMAVVYLAYDPRFRRKVAIKLVSVSLQENPVFRERFEREAQLIARIEHPAIVPVYDFGEEDGQPYLVMRYMPGGALSSKMKGEMLPLAYATQVLSQIAPALDAVHAQDIIHRDLKPANILFDSFNNPAISDFGIAHFTQATADLTGSAVIGTPSYMSPEQVRSDTDLDGRSDIYALGVILFEMLTGRGPYQAPTPLSIAMKHLTEPTPSVLTIRHDLPPEVDHVLQKAMAKDREKRYASASEMVSDLQAITDTVQHEVRPVSPPIGAVRTAELATEVDTGEDSVPPPPAADPPQPDNLQAKPRSQPSRPVRAPARSAIPRFAGLAGIALCVILVCGITGGLGLWSSLGLPGLAAGQDPVDTPVRTPTSQPTPQPQEVVLLEDDFTDPSTGWPNLRNEQGGYSYQADGYHIVVAAPEAVLWAKTSREYDNTSIHVEAKPVAPDQNGYYGLLCRIRDDLNFYYFVVRNNGEYTLGKYKDGQFQSLLAQGWKQSNAVRPGSETNRIRADCVGDTLRLYANNVLLDEVTDADFTSGYSGLLAAALDSQEFEVLFNDFMITEPGQ